ncbi:hypothetical protein K3556_09885 [Aliiroseovarius sp. M344]|uniref:hypothetical protein n=1 Tax=Aliiroseovarius sp. M344 TaxID=2867010 RepID=UPI0021AD779A|nr:hypothetical protein [Aliiroseovarius sp. M344]UWQ13270.1 hypothetical protein K3556_09885 [Aliiroseovarius sp. M344]
MKQMILAGVMAAVPLSILAQAEKPAEVILCRGEAGDTVTVELWTPSQFDQPLHCIRADFIAEAAVCAPHGGWGLSSDAAVPELVEVTNDWKTAHTHQAGKVTAIEGAKAVRFNAQYGVGIGSNLSYEWKFTLDRRTGSATWFTKDGEKFTYDCLGQS